MIDLSLKSLPTLSLAAMLAIQLSSASMALAQDQVIDLTSDNNVDVVHVGIVLSEQAQSLKDALQVSGKSAEAYSAFYAANGYKHIWTAARKVALLNRLMASDDHGLPLARYDLDTLSATLQNSSVPIDQAEIAATTAFLKYARDVSTGFVEPRSVDRDITIKRPEFDAAAALKAFDDQVDTVGAMAKLAPRHPHYIALQADKKRLEALILTGGWGDVVSSGKSLKPGAVSPRITELRARLMRMEGKNYGDAPEFDETLEDAIKAFQLRHGLNDDGVIGPMTLAAINASPDDRLKQVLVNMERQRWLNFDRGSRHVYVNQADFSVSLIDNGKTTFWSRVVIGKNGHRTQEFNDTMTHMVINPTWNVPRSIATEEMLPRLKRNPSSLGSSMVVMTRNGTRVNPKYVNFSQFNKRNFPFIVKQRPGSRNALGRVKFMFPNKFNIYLHDTPSKSLFNRDARAYSHGCVRVQKPFEFAYALLAPQAEEPEKLFKSYLNGGRERQLNLETHLPVYLTYQSTWTDENGVPQYRGDIYGRDAKLFKALTNAGVSLPTVEG